METADQTIYLKPSTKLRLKQIQVELETQGRKVKTPDGVINYLINGFPFGKAGNN